VGAYDSCDIGPGVGDGEKISVVICPGFVVPVFLYLVEWKAGNEILEQEAACEVLDAAFFVFDIGRDTGMA